MYNILCDNCEWNQWEELGIDDTIEGPIESDHYNGPHGLKEGGPRKFETVLHCRLKTTAMDDLFCKIGNTIKQNGKKKND